MLTCWRPIARDITLLATLLASVGRARELGVGTKPEFVSL